MKKAKSMAYADVWCALVYIAVALYAIVVSTGFKEFRNSTVNPADFPRIMAIGLMAFSLLLLATSVTKLLRGDPGGEPAPILSLRDRGIQFTLLCFAASVVYTALWGALGFLILAPVTLFVMMRMIGLRNWRTMIFVSCALPVIMWLLFYVVLSISIPLGPLGIIYDVF